MPLNALQHINIRCDNAERSRDFYAGVLQLTVGPRPPFASQGFWLYLGNQPVVHLVQKRPDEQASPANTGALDHIAFGGQELDAMRQRLTGMGVPFREAFVPRDNVVQLFVVDPDGVQLELNFPQ
jgi:catechol 2,3-dioxygenase-like lactoylglutathione lyase family enzyme